VTDPSLVLVAHGSRDVEASRTTRAIVQVVLGLRPALPVSEAYLEHAQPDLPSVLRAVGEGAVVVPLLLSPGFHSAADIPRQLAAVGSDAGRLSPVLGPHDLLVDALERRLGEAGVEPGEPGTGIVLAAAGSSDPTGVAAVREMAARWRMRRGWPVEAAFASSAAPTVEEAVARLRDSGVRRVAVASYLLFPGLFADRLTATDADVVSAPLGAAPEVAALVLERYDAVVAALGHRVELAPRR
jgi:sirohydrochlorin ferrochelatase